MNNLKTNEQFENFISKLPYNSNGGNSNDFSIAKVNITNDGGITIGLPYVYFESEIAAGQCNQTAEYNVILYKGKAAIGFGSEIIVNSGACAYDNELGCYVITGDCSISFTR